METLCLVLIILGALIMASNIVMYFFFAKNMHDIIFSGKKKDEALLSVGMALLVFFLIGYILVGIFADRYIMTSLILFFGSIYVSVMLLITSKLIFSSKKKSIEIASVLIGVIDARDPNLNGHSHCVKNVAMLLYSKLPLPMRMSINPVSLEFAALLHDIGWEKDRPVGEVSAEVAVEYLDSIDVSPELIVKVGEIILACDEMDTDKDLSLECQIVMDSILLDEVGAVEIMRDCMVAADDDEASYKRAYYRIKENYRQNKPLIRCCKTETARTEYNKRMQLIESYIYQLEREIF